MREKQIGSKVPPMEDYSQPAKKRVLKHLEKEHNFTKKKAYRPFNYESIQANKMLQNFNLL